MAKEEDAKNQEKPEDVKAEKADDKPPNAADKKESPDKGPQAADEKAGEKQKAANDDKADKKTAGSRFAPLLPWLLTAAVVVVCAGIGFVLGRLLAGPGEAKAAETTGTNNAAETTVDLKADTAAADSQKVWYYDLSPVVANLDVPGVTRYVRVAVTLEIGAEVDVKKCTAFLAEKNPLLTNWLTIYLAGLNLDDIRGDNNLRHIQAQILDAFNERLFPDAKPQIKNILFKEFAIQ